MKNYVVLIVIVIIAVTSITYLFFNYRNNYIQIEENNKEYVNLYNKEVNGNYLATIINKTLDKNSKNDVIKDENEYYINNGTNSINIEVKFKDSDKTFRIEQISKNGIENFIKLYSNINFKCIKMEYHAKTKLISYLYFEQL